VELRVWSGGGVEGVVWSLGLRGQVHPHTRFFFLFVTVKPRVE